MVFLIVLFFCELMCTWQIGRARDARGNLKTSRGKLVSDKLHKGVSPHDVICWLSYIKSENLHVRGIIQ
jgi:hypothetical protein